MIFDGFEFELAQDQFHCRAVPIFMSYKRREFIKEKRNFLRGSAV
jgi:hypothetical protein